jgi:hypothetical protein
MKKMQMTAIKFLFASSISGGADERVIFFDESH